MFQGHVGLGWDSVRVEGESRAEITLPIDPPSPLPAHCVPATFFTPPTPLLPLPPASPLPPDAATCGVQLYTYFYSPLSGFSSLSV
ncbi:hypothetical protein E2C01_074150 [Portunus trituberculatus]|uniref:Uncharacterized protein n=1 Tax=Portunus trituberculatus TaxID=210409 RepID=A0A5B7IGD6_PORTR|nr:hypothetical protein [Portunus trituberculatus]